MILDFEVTIHDVLYSVITGTPVLVNKVIFLLSAANNTLPQRISVQQLVMTL